jgi:glyoxylase-like metal-dependent hydrolase (beta-lactamase superfamily II)
MTCLVSNSHSRIGTRQNAELLRRQAGFALSTAVAIAFSIGGISTEAAAQTFAPAYENMPAIPPIGIRIGKYMDVPESAKGPAIDAVKGYRIQNLGKDLYMVTDNAVQAMFLVYEDGVVLVDVPQTLASAIPKAIAEVTIKPITHLIYSHSHADHIGGAGSLNGRPMIIAHEETKKLLARANDSQRPLPTTTFNDTYTLNVGSHRLELSYHGDGHEPGNIFIYAPAQKTLMVIDVIFPGWMMWRRFAVAHDIPGVFTQVELIKTFDFETLVSGHVTRSGTRADVDLQMEFMNDLQSAAAEALKTTRVGEGVDPRDLANPWAVFDNFIDRVVIQCVNALTPKWSQKLAGFDVYIWDQCYSTEQSLRID